MSIAWDKRNKRWRFHFDRYVQGVRKRAWLHAMVNAHPSVIKAWLDTRLERPVDRSAEPA